MTEAALRSAVKKSLEANQHVVDEHQYTVPSVSSYPYQWLWDSCFHAIMYSYTDVNAGKAEMRSLLSRQWDNGMVPHIIYWQNNPNILQIDWGVEKTSTITQPPLLAHAIWKLYQASGDNDFLAELYPKLSLYHQYLWDERRLPNRDLLGIINPDESGEDNSPRFDRAQALPVQHHVEENQTRRFALFDMHRDCQYNANTCTSAHFWVEDVPFNVFAILALEAMSNIARELGEDASVWTHQAHAIATAMREHLFFDGSFWSVEGHAHEPIFVDTWARFAPLMVGLYSKEEAADLIQQHYHNTDSFARPHLLPTVAANDPSYDPEEPTWGEAWQHPDWRGAVWMLPNWCVYHGLKRYGFDIEARALRHSSLRLIKQSDFRENYHPETGIGMGAVGFTWSGLVIDMR